MNLVNNSVCSCSACSGPFGVAQTPVCNVCDGRFHAICAGLTQDVVDVLMTIVDSTGWVCPQCRTDVRLQLRGLQAGQAKLAEEVASLKIEVSQLKADLVKSSAVPDQWPKIQTGQLNGDLRDAVRKEIVSEASEKQRRRRNVIVSGMPVPPNSSADAVFLNLCESEFGCKPSIIAAKCGPIDKPLPGKVPRLRIVFTNEEARDNVLLHARQLRLSSDAAAKQVYINPDLTPSEARAAYEERVKRRSRLNSSVPPFQPTTS